MGRLTRGTRIVKGDAVGLSRRHQAVRVQVRLCILVSGTQVHAALADYWSHEEELQRDIAEGQKLVSELKAKSGPSKFQEKLVDPSWLN
jgi:hypothetical protein